MYADTNVTIPGAKFPNIGLKIDIKLQKNDLHIILGRIHHSLASAPSEFYYRDINKFYL